MASRWATEQEGRQATQCAQERQPQPRVAPAAENRFEDVAVAGGTALVRLRGSSSKPACLCSCTQLWTRHGTGLDVRSPGAGALWPVTLCMMWTGEVKVSLLGDHAEEGLNLEPFCNIRHTIL